MATINPVNYGGTFCRACSNALTKRGRFAWCETPGIVCDNLSRDNRECCEHDAFDLRYLPAGPARRQPCPNCGQPPTRGR